MDAMTAMLSRMIGLKPEDMQKMVKDLQGLVISTAEKVSAMHTMAIDANTRLTAIEAKLEELTSGGQSGTSGNGPDSSSVNDRGRGRKSGSRSAAGTSPK